MNIIHIVINSIQKKVATEPMIMIYIAYVRTSNTNVSQSRKQISFVNNYVSREYPINTSVPNSKTKIIKNGKDARVPVYGTSDYQYPKYILSQLPSSKSGCEKTIEKTNN